MPQHTVDAFRWSGTGYNATYDTSYTAVFDDDDGQFQGSGDASETVSIDGGAFGATGGAPHVITVNFTDTDGDPHVEEFYFFYAGSSGGWYFVPGPGSEFTVGATLGMYQSHYNGWDYSTVTCFTAGTQIATRHGGQPVESLKAGDIVMSHDGRELRLRQVLRRNICVQDMRRHERLRPIHISKGALGPGVPARDLKVSRQHRILLRSVIAQRMFGHPEVLVAAARLTLLPGVFVDPVSEPVSYVHLLFDRHEIILANGTPAESFYPGVEALHGLPSAAREEIELLFPALCEGTSPDFVRNVPPRARQKRLVERLASNRKPALETRPRA